MAYDTTPTNPTTITRNEWLKEVLLVTIAFLTARAVLGAALAFWYQLTPYLFERPVLLGILGSQAGMLGIWLAIGSGKRSHRLLVVFVWLLIGMWTLALFSRRYAYTTDSIRVGNLWLIAIGVVDFLTILATALCTTIARWWLERKTWAQHQWQVSLLDLMLLTVVISLCLTMRKDLRDALLFAFTTFWSSPAGLMLKTLRVFAGISSAGAILAAIGLLRPQPRLRGAIAGCTLLIPVAVLLQLWPEQFPFHYDDMREAAWYLVYYALGALPPLFVISWLLGRAGVRLQRTVTLNAE